MTFISCWSHVRYRKKLEENRRKQSGVKERKVERVSDRERERERERKSLTRLLCKKQNF